VFQVPVLKNRYLVVIAIAPTLVPVLELELQGFTKLVRERTGRDQVSRIKNQDPGFRYRC
jgi:hypothetical protein